MSGGYMGRLLNVDLTSRTLRDETLDEATKRDFIGGYGVGARLLYDRIRPGIDALGPENVLAVLTGPLTGTPAIEGNRSVFVCKSPLTGTWGDANCGGTFGAHLKFAGYDGVIMTGAADRPVYISIIDGKAELHDASDLWGKDANETEDLLKARYGKEVQVASIGQAGERRNLIACIINDYGRAWGRSGVGAVMGSKHVKAIVVRGNARVPLHNEEKTRELKRYYLKKHDGAYELFVKYGTVGILGESSWSGDSPVKNWGGAGTVDFPQGKEVFKDELLIRTYQDKKYGCWQCTMACGGHMSVKDPSSPYYGTHHHKTEYETGCSFATMMLIDDFPFTIKANELCNRYGLDTISAGCTIAWAMECFENGILTLADTDGIELRWGNHRAVIEALHRLGKREGAFGELLADGCARAAARVGRGAEQFAIHIQGQEVPMHDPRFEPGLATTYQMDATPARHTQGGAYWFPPGYQVPESFDKFDYDGKGDIHKWMACMMHVVNASGVCQFAFSSYDYHFIPDFLTAVTGTPYDEAECQRVGERIGHMRHAFNLREGLNPFHYKINGRIIGDPPLTAGNNRGVTVDLKTQSADFARAMGWDTVTARPKRERLQALGLDFLQPLAAD